MLPRLWHGLTCRFFHEGFQTLFIRGVKTIIEFIRRHHKSGKSLQQIADWLNQQGYQTKRGQQWQRISVKRVLDRLYGKTARISSMSS
jgi:hypothetical protein